MSLHPVSVPRERQIFCNRTLNLRSIQAIGYDMDYTLVHYNVEAWEGRAYAHIKQRLLAMEWPVDDLDFDPDFATRGLVIDTELGNVCKANRFGYVKSATHGMSQIGYPSLRRAYARTLIDLGESRWQFMNTFFSISEACIYMQLVDRLDAGELPKAMGYRELYATVRSALDAAHLEGELKADIMASPEQYVELDPELPLALRDQKDAGKTLLLITNSEWFYTRFMMDYAFDRFLPEGETWRDIFDLMVVSARKPSFFENASPAFEVVTDEGLLKPVVGPLKKGGIYLGGHASMVEDCFGLDGEQILYVGDHIYGDVSVSKSVLRWRTALIMRELEDELRAIETASDNSDIIAGLMKKKERMEHEFSAIRLHAQQIAKGYLDGDVDALKQEMHELRTELQAVDSQIGPLVSQDGEAFNSKWGYLMRAGNDKSHLTRQIERYADIYTSRVSNLLKYTPFMYFRSPRGSLPHDPS